MTVDIEFFTNQMVYRGKPAGGAGGIGSPPAPVPLTAASANIDVQVFAGSDVDLTGNHVFVAGTVYSANGYNGESVLDTTGANASIVSNGGTAHEIITANPVTFGGFFYQTSASGATPYFVTSSVAGGAGNHNYSLVQVGGVMNFQSGPAGSLTGLGYTVPINSWFHITMQVDAGRTTGQFYVNGKAFGAPLAGMTAGGPAAPDDLYISGVGGVAGGELDGYASNIFVTDTALSAASIRTLAENAFGHGLPA